MDDDRQTQFMETLNQRNHNYASSIINACNDQVNNVLSKVEQKTEETSELTDISYSPSIKARKWQETLVILLLIMMKRKSRLRRVPIRGRHYKKNGTPIQRKSKGASIFQQLENSDKTGDCCEENDGAESLDKVMSSKPRL